MKKQRIGQKKNAFFFTKTCAQKLFRDEKKSVKYARLTSEIGEAKLLFT
jgi:hypothetical protein